MGSFPEGHNVNAHEVKPGVVYKDANVTVTAFPTQHAMDSYGYRFETADRRIVISGDTNPTQATIDACNGCDVLIHEVLTHDWLSRRPDLSTTPRSFIQPRANLPSWRRKPDRAYSFFTTRRLRGGLQLTISGRDRKCS